jgi:hypothetical protein
MVLCEDIIPLRVRRLQKMTHVMSTEVLQGICGGERSGIDRLRALRRRHDAAISTPRIEHGNPNACRSKPADTFLSHVQSRKMGPLLVEAFINMRLGKLYRIDKAPCPSPVF